MDGADRAAGGASLVGVTTAISGDAIIVLDGSSSIVAWSPTAERLFGPLASQVIGQPIGRVLLVEPAGATGRRGPAPAPRLLSTVSGPAVILVPATNRRVAAAVWSAPLLDGGSLVLVVVSSLVDREKVLRELVGAQKMAAIGALVSGVAHQINNPLTVVRGYADLIATDPAAPIQTRQDARLIVDSADQVRDLVRTFADFARDRPTARGRVHLRDVVARARDLLSYDLMAPRRPHSGHARLEVHLGEHLPDVAADHATVEHIIVTLVQNSLDAFRSSFAATTGELGLIGTIRLSAEVDRATSRIHLHVGDDGPGIAADVAERLFQPFVTSRPDGRGLGLWAAARLAETGGGRLRLAPPTSGSGAEFVLELPTVEPVADHPSAREASQGASALGIEGARRSLEPPVSRWDRPGMLRILAAEDEGQLRDLLGRVIGAQPDVALMLAASGTEAIDAIRLDRFDVLILDSGLGAGPTGTQVLEAAVEMDPAYATRTILVTGSDEIAHSRAAIQRHGLVVVEKPYRMEDLLALARHVAASAAGASDTADGLFAPTEGESRATRYPLDHNPPRPAGEESGADEAPPAAV